MARILTDEQQEERRVRGARGVAKAGRGALATIAVGCALGSLIVRPSTANAQSVDECIATKLADGVARPEAVTACISKERSTSTNPAAPEPQNTADTKDDGGASVVTLALVALAGAAAGAGSMAFIGRRRAHGSAAPATPAAAAHGGLPAPRPPVATPAHGDRSSALIDALIDLSDRVPSPALRNDIVDALERAGVRSFEVAPGTAFDAATMHGVGSVRTDDPSSMGLVASCERCGFADGARIIRMPDVTVHRAE